MYIALSFRCKLSLFPSFFSFPKFSSLSFSHSVPSSFKNPNPRKLPRNPITTTVITPRFATRKTSISSIMIIKKYSSSSSSSSSSFLFFPNKMTKTPLPFLLLLLLLSGLVLLRHHPLCPPSLPLLPPLPARSLIFLRSGPHDNDTSSEFWHWEEGDGRYRPCLEFGIRYRKASPRISKEKRRFLVVEVTGGINQQRNQIVDAVVVARILEAALVVPALQFNRIWGDESKFSEIFDVEHFKKTLKADVRVVPSLPFRWQRIESKIPQHATPQWIHSRFFNQMNRDGVLVLKGFDSKLTKNLPPDLQKLKCKVAFHALRFAAPIRAIGDQLAKRMWIEGPYIAIHLRLEKDVWVRTGCLTGLGPEYDDAVAKVRESHPEFLTGTLKLTQTQRRRAGLCPLNALEMARFLKAIGVPRSTQIYRAGGEPFGGSKALQPLVAEFPNVATKETLAREGELLAFANKSSALAAIDYIVSLSSDLFVPSHGGNMARAMQGHRAYMGHRRFIKPNKRLMVPLLENSTISEAEFGVIMREIHNNSEGQPEMRNHKRDRDVIAYPVPECMCKTNRKFF